MLKYMLYNNNNNNNNKLVRNDDARGVKKDFNHIFVKFSIFWQTSLYYGQHIPSAPTDFI